MGLCSSVTQRCIRNNDTVPLHNALATSQNVAQHSTSKFIFTTTVFKQKTSCRLLPDNHNHNVNVGQRIIKFRFRSRDIILQALIVSENNSGENLSSATAALMSQPPPPHFCSTVVRLIALQVINTGVRSNHKYSLVLYGNESTSLSCVLCGKFHANSNKR